MEEKEVVLTSVEQFKEYLKNTADDKTVVSVVLELAGEDADKEGGGSLYTVRSRSQRPIRRQRLWLRHFHRWTGSIAA